VAEHGGGGGGDSKDAYLMGGFLLLMALIIGADFYMEYVLAAWRWLRLAEFFVLQWIPSWVPYFGSLPIDAAYECLKVPGDCINTGRLTTEFAGSLDRATLTGFSWIPGIFFIVVGIRQIMRTEDVSTRHDMETLMRANAPLYKHVEPYINIHPEKAPLRWDPTDPSTAATGCSMSPETFATIVPPVGLENEAKKKSLYRQPIWDGNLEFDVDLAERAFAAQLGQRFMGVDKLSPVQKKVYDQLTRGLTYSQESIIPLIRTALAKKGTSTLESEQRVIKAIREKLKTDKKLPKGQRDLVAKLFSEKELEPLYRITIAERVLSQHGFVITGLMSLLEEARRGGVVAGCELIWVKGEDRTLWYALNSVGRKVSYVESAGAFAHWLIERHLKRPITHPAVGEAVKGLELALKLDIRKAFAEEASL
jgi:hypothetical protein